MQAGLSKILIVEDDLLNQKLTTLYLARLGYQTDLAVNGQQAVLAVTSHNYDLVLMDCQMPFMDGFEATWNIRLLDKKFQRFTPIIAVTSNVSEYVREKCLEAGMNDYLTKPLQIEQLKEVIAYWINKFTAIKIDRDL